MSPSYTDADSAPAPQRKYRSTSSGNFPSPGDLVGELLRIDPVKIDMVEDDGKWAKAGPDGKKPLKARLTANVVVLTGQNKSEHEAMWWSQGSIVKAAQSILDRIEQGRAKPGDELMLGRLYRLPKRDVLEHYKDRQGLEAAIRRGDRVPGTDYFWVLADGDTRDDDIALAEAYDTGNADMSPDAEADPFEDD